MTSTRARFMESQGCGVQVLMSAKTAIELGASIYGVVAYTSTTTDNACRSIPAPDKHPSKFPRLTLEYRKRQLVSRRKQISDWLENEIKILKSTVSHPEAGGTPMSPEDVSEQYALIEGEVKRQKRNSWVPLKCSWATILQLRLSSKH